MMKQLQSAITVACAAMVTRLLSQGPNTALLRRVE